MKIRLTIMTENNKHSDDVTEGIVQELWQKTLDLITTFSSDPYEKAIVEKVEIIEN